jgi:hypothetical protein
MRTNEKRAKDAMKRSTKYGYDPYNSVNTQGWLYHLKWCDDLRRSRSEKDANMALADKLRII